MLQFNNCPRSHETTDVEVNDDRDVEIETLADEMYHEAKEADEADTRFAAGLVAVWSCDANAFGAADLEQVISYMRAEHARRVAKKAGN